MGEYTEVERPNRLCFTITDMPGEAAGEPVTVDIRPINGISEMTLVQQADHFTEAQAAQTVIGYNGFFDSMKTVLAETSATSSAATTDSPGSVE